MTRLRQQANLRGAMHNQFRTGRAACVFIEEKIGFFAQILAQRTKMPIVEKDAAQFMRK
jgi:hypothetical protein